MLTLALFRHAKSSWDSPAIDDFDRPLSPRGKKAAPKMAAFLAKQDLAPDHILCSSARRTRDTLALALPAWKIQPSIAYADALYLANVPRLLAITRNAPTHVRHLMIIGHNPGLQAFALHLIGSGDQEARAALNRKFPTAAIAVIGFDAENWADIKPNDGHLMLFATPKQVKDA